MCFVLAPPPSYDSLFGRVREAQKTSKGVLDFIKNILIILLGTCNLLFFLGLTVCKGIRFYFVAVGCTIILGVTIVIPICMIVMGSVYLRECPQGEYIPVYLLVGGKSAIKMFYFYALLLYCVITFKTSLFTLFFIQEYLES